MLDKVTMHESTKVDSTPKDTYQPNPKEEAAIKLVMRKFEDYKAYRAKYDGDWMENYEMFRGKQWKEARPSYRHSEVINLIFQDIQSVVPILTDTKPKISFLPVEPGDRPLAEVFDKIYDFEWRTKKWQDVLTECLYDSHIYGTCYASMEHEVVEGKGSAVFESKDPFYCFPDPDSHDVNRKGNGFIYAEPVRLETAKRKYKEFAKFMKPDITDLLEQDKTTLGKVKFQTATDKKAPMYEADGPKHYSPDKMVLDITYYCRDDSYDEEEIKDEKGKKKYQQTLKYPKGRKIHVVGGVLVEDAENTYNDYAKRFAPFARKQNYILPREFYGISEVEQTKGPQRIFNKLVSFALDVLTTMGNPIWIVDDTSGIDVDNIINRPGLVMEKTPGSEVRREEGVQLQPYVLALIDRMQGWFGDISGATDITHGKKPEGVSSAIAIRTVQNASHTRLRLKSRLIEGFLQDIGQMYISRVFQFYTAPQIFRISNDQEIMKYFKMSIDPSKEEGGKSTVNYREIAEEPGNKPVESELMQHETMGQFDVVPTMGSSLPFAKEERVALALQLLREGVVDPEEVLTAADYPNKEKVLQRMQEKQQTMMQEQQAGEEIQMQKERALKEQEQAGKVELQERANAAQTQAQ